MDENAPPVTDGQPGATAETRELIFARTLVSLNVPLVIEARQDLGNGRFASYIGTLIEGPCDEREEFVYAMVEPRRKLLSLYEQGRIDLLTLFLDDDKGYWWRAVAIEGTGRLRAELQPESLPDQLLPSEGSYIHLDFESRQRVAHDLAADIRDLLEQFQRLVKDLERQNRPRVAPFVWKAMHEAPISGQNRRWPIPPKPLVKPPMQKRSDFLETNASLDFNRISLKWVQYTEAMLTHHSLIALTEEQSVYALSYEWLADKFGEQHV